MPPMAVFLFKRLSAFLATLVVASMLVFAVLELLPGNAAQVILGDSANVNISINGRDYPIPASAQSGRLARLDIDGQ